MCHVKMWCLRGSNVQCSFTKTCFLLSVVLLLRIHRKTILGKYNDHFPSNHSCGWKLSRRSMVLLLAYIVVKRPTVNIIAHYRSFKAYYRSLWGGWIPGLCVTMFCQCQ